MIHNVFPARELLPRYKSRFTAFVPLMLNPPTVVSVTLMIASAVNDFPVVLLSTVEIAGNCMETTLLAASVALAVWVSWYHTACPVNGVSMPI